jgi:hypothetical protein
VTTVIYVAHIQEQKFIKIGFAADVPRRLRELQTGNPYKITLLFTVEGTLRQEQAIHDALARRFEALHLPAPFNEWFPGRHQFVEAFLAELRVSANSGIAFADEYSKRGRWMGGAGHIGPRAIRL